MNCTSPLLTRALCSVKLHKGLSFLGYFASQAGSAWLAQQQQSPQMFPWDSCKFLASSFLAPAVLRSPRWPSKQGDKERRLLPGARPCCQPSKGFSLCLLPVTPARSISTLQGNENSSLSTYFIKCCPWCSNRLRTQTTQIKTIKRRKTEDW